MMPKKGLKSVAYALVIIGALNWGLVGLFELNVVNVLLGSISMLERLVYILVGASAILLLLPEKGMEMHAGHADSHKEMSPPPQPEPPKEMQSPAMPEEEKRDMPLPPPSDG